MYIENINSPADVKKLNIMQLNVLAEEMRHALLTRASKHGGHFGPNFGMVEAIISMHYVFDSPTDKIVFDVSHQCYPHKILTGRKDAYLYEEHYDDVSGYTNPDESEHDFFTVGHTSTSISLACGLAKARDLNGEDGNVIAVIGDGSLSGGEALEGLDFASELNSNMIIVANDNDMSIAENHGGLYANLKLLRETNGQAECNLFKAMNLDYIYVDKGNDIASLIEAFEKVKDTKKAVVVHINTLKGKGYAPAEQNKEEWHWHMPFDIATGESLFKGGEPDFSDASLEYLLKKMDDDKSVVAITAGTIELLASWAGSSLPTWSVPVVFSLIGAVMSFFSSTLGVVCPALFPLVPALAQATGLNPLIIFSSIVIGAQSSAISPFSSGGSLIIGSCTTEEERNHMFPKLLFEAVPISVIFAAVFNVVLSFIL